MTTLTILYGHPEDPEAFERYYSEEHLPWAGETMPGVLDARLHRFIAAPDGSQAPYYRLAQMTWEDRDSLDSALASEAGREVLADTDNFATGGVTMLIGEESEPGQA